MRQDEEDLVRVILDLRVEGSLGGVETHVDLEAVD